jgi:hypothetical protein
MSELLTQRIQVAGTKLTLLHFAEAVRYPRHSGPRPFLHHLYRVTKDNSYRPSHDLSAPWDKACQP